MSRQTVCMTHRVKDATGLTPEFITWSEKFMKENEPLLKRLADFSDKVESSSTKRVNKD